MGKITAEQLNQRVERIKEIIRVKLPSNLVVAEHTDDGHFYRYIPTGVLMNSVTARTGILDSPHLKQWVAKTTVDYISTHLEVITQENKEDHFKAAQMAHRDIFLDAGAIGSVGHEAVDKYLKVWLDTGKQPEDIKVFCDGSDYREFAIARSAELFCKDYNVIPIATELRVASPKYGYAGTMDGLMIIDGILTLIDWKSSNSINKDGYALQTVAYWQAFKELTGIRPKRIWIVRLDKGSAKYEIVNVQDISKAFRIFINLSKVYNWLNNGTTKLYPLNQKNIIKL